MNVSGSGGQLSYWRTPAGSEVDFIWTRGQRAVGMEVKSGPRWRQQDGAPLKHVVANGTIQRGLGIYLGEKRLRDGPLDVLPVPDFLDQLGAGKVLR